MMNQKIRQSNSVISPPLTFPIAILPDLLLQDNRVNTRLEQCEDRACFPLQASQGIEDLR